MVHLPEELLARILAIAIAHNPRRIAPLLASKQFLRIASPFLYHTLYFRSARQATCALDTLTRHTPLANAVRRVVFDGIWQSCAGVLALCDRIQDVDVCLDGGPDTDAEAFCHALEQRRSIVHLTIRKDPAVYLTHPRPVYIFQRLAETIQHWTDLETVHLALRISATPTTLPLARALSVAPRLRAVRAQLPAIWNDVLLVISTNPRLEKVMLYAEPTSGSIQNRPMGSAVIKPGYICDEIEHAVLGTGLYMMEAKKHARLSELIKNGTSIIRTRAHTTILTLSIASAGGTPLGPIRAKEVAVDLMANRDNFGLPAAQPLAATRQMHARDI